MKYISTRGGEAGFESSLAILQGIAPDGGLLVPDELPQVSESELRALSRRSYPERVADILARFLTDYRPDELLDYARQAYAEDRFDPSPAPVVGLNKYLNREFVLELWHGPTGAFKDMALQILPHLLTAAVRKTGSRDRVAILAATSGDTGKAALEGFRDIPGTDVVVFYPEKGVSDAQRRQMTTQEGANCHVVAVEGNFDDAQAGVKAIFQDPELSGELAAAGIRLSSANSINWGRLAPQVAYYFSAYCDLLAANVLEPGERINFVVPTGNFGNILAAWYALRMGLPIRRLICASNRNKVLSDFIRNGTYDRRREFFRTLSPSMDILVSSNLERLLFELAGRDPAAVRNWMADLRDKGQYTIDAQSLRRLQEVFVGGFADDQGTTKSIRELYDRLDHVFDPHTAVGFNVYERYAARSGDAARTVFVATASPYKFCPAVCDALYGNGFSRGRGEPALVEALARESGLPAPSWLQDMAGKPVLHDRKIDRNRMKDEVRRILLKSED